MGIPLPLMDSMKVRSISCSSLGCMVHKKLVPVLLLVSIQRKTAVSSLNARFVGVASMKSRRSSLQHRYSKSFSIKPLHSSRIQTSKVYNPVEVEDSSVSDQSSDEASDSDEGDGEIDDERNSVEEETLGLLEWPRICIQVSQFASTPMGLQIAREGSLPICATVVESDELQAQTAAAKLLLSPLDFSDIEDLRDIVGGALSGNVCQLDELCRVKRTLASTRRLCDQVFGTSIDEGSLNQRQQKQGAASHDPLQAMILGCNLCSELESSIEHCLDCSFSAVLDRASPKLAAVRQKRQENNKALEALLKETAAMVVNAGGMDSPLVTKRRGRMCVAVRASHKSLLSGGVALDLSNSGATFFMEPEPALHFNNEEIRLAVEEQLEETAVLRQLTFMLLDVGEDVVDLLERVTSLDLACARAGYSAWLDAVRPVFTNSDDHSFPPSDITCADGKNLGEENMPLIDIKGVRHPLLLGSALPAPLYTHRFGIAQQKAIRRNSSSSARKISGNLPVERRNVVLPVPIDIKVEAGVKVVTITGPNTGGKTAALKTLGVSAVMAKAGLCLPASGVPRLPWFDSILADIGDDQSLERSLSTFSGHIRRVCEILEAGTNHSLVLLDEIGGGTDPSEGAALATAVLRSLANSVQLTLATTHCAELRTLKDHDPEFENASVEFDIKTLRPTYRVLWGIAGQSNALNIAASLGFDPGVLTRARELVTKLVPASLGARTTELMVPLVKQRDEQRERARAAGAALAAVSNFHNELQSEARNLAQREAKLRRAQEEAVDDSVSEANARLERILSKFQESAQQSSGDESPFSMRDAQAAIATITEEYAPDPVELNTSTFLNDLGMRGKKGDVGGLLVGERVVIRRLGKMPATIIELPQGDSDYLTVQLGSMKMQVKSSEILSRGTSMVTGESNPPAVKQVKQPVKPTRLKQPELQNEEAKYEVAVQTSRNTLDLRGKRVEESLRELDMALASRAPQSVLFVVHGMGTGAVKEAVWQVLKKHPYVAKFEQESVMNPGCTIVYIK